MRHHTGSYGRKRVNADKLLERLYAARIADEVSKAKMLQLDRLHSLWSPVIYGCLNAMGESKWGAGNYEISEGENPDACWIEYQVKGLEWHERTDRLQVRNQDDWCECEYRFGYRMRLEVRGDQFTMGNVPLTQDSLVQWSLDVVAAEPPQCVEEHVIRFY